jgi:hypothetical protein
LRWQLFFRHDLGQILCNLRMKIFSIPYPSPGICFPRL